MSFPNTDKRSGVIHCKACLDHQRALDPLFKDFTAHMIGAVDIAGCVIGIRCASARAVQLCPAFCTLRTGVHITELERIPKLRVGNTLPDISHPELGIIDKLVAGIQVS